MTCMYVRFPTPLARDRMWALLSEQDWATVGRTEEHARAVQPVLGEELGLGVRAGRRLIGFPTMDVPQWGWMVMAWMSVRAGDHSVGWPVVRYGDDEIPVLVQPHGPSTDRDGIVVDDMGIIRAVRGWDAPIGPDTQAQEAFITGLEAAWTARVAPRAKRSR